MKKWLRRIRCAVGMGLTWAAPHYIRSMAEALGRTPPASRYSADMFKHVFFGTEPAGAEPRVQEQAVMQIP